MFGKSVLRKQIRQRFVVTCHSGLVFSGVLIDDDDKMRVFADVKLVSEGMTPAQGHLYIEPTQIAYMQLIQASDAAL